MAKKKKSNKKVKLSADQQLDHLKQRFGSSVNWVEVTLPMTFDEVNSYFGPECKEYNHLCGCCLAWSQWHRTNKVTVIIERNNIIKALNS